MSPSTLTPIVDKALKAAQVELWIKRDDLLHPVISGNKWRKLKYVLNHALELDADTVISMGGAYSNHLHALAFAGKFLGLKTVAYVRGEKPATGNPTLDDLRHWGMELCFVSRSDYRRLREYTTHDSLPGLKPGHYWLPEGGACGLALQGVAEIITEIDRDYEVLMTACGTGTTLAGLIAAAPAGKRILGVSALKGGDFLQADVQKRLPTTRKLADWRILLDYHFGGFGKVKPALNAWVDEFARRHGLPLEPVYTGKALFALYDLINQGYFEPRQRIVFLHTGGLQGVRAPLNP